MADIEAIHARPPRTDVRRRILIAIAAVCALAVAGMTIARLTGQREWVFPLILLASTSYLALAIAVRAWTSNFGRLIIVGLVFCYIGDVVGPGNFMLGLYAFLVGHFFFIGACALRGFVPGRALMTIAVFLVADAAILAYILPGVAANERIQVLAYTAVVSGMAIAASACKPGIPTLMPAGVIFFVSDVFVAKWRYAPGLIDGYICYVLYYAACLLFAYTAGWKKTT